MTEMNEPDSNRPDYHGYEKRDVNLAKVVGYGVVSIVIITVLLVSAVDYFSASKEELVQEVVLKPQSVTLQELRAREDEELSSYKLLDSTKPVYGIPISRAIELIADEAGQNRTAAGGKQ